MKQRVMIVALLLVMSLPCLAGGERLEVKVWAALDPFVGGEDGPLTEDDLRRRLLEEARVVLSGMLYGYRFRYTPSDRIRGVEEEFSLDPVAEIKWGDPSLQVEWIQEREHKVWAGISYRMADYQKARVSSWESNVMPASTGRGERPLVQGRQEKQGSLEEAIKQAIRGHARSQMPNKPRVLAGDVLIWGAPETVVGSGMYITTVRVKLFLQRRQPYQVY